MLSEIPASQMWGLAEDVEPSWLRKRHLVDDDGVQNVCEGYGYRVDITERELLHADPPRDALTVSWTRVESGSCGD